MDDGKDFFAVGGHKASRTSSCGPEGCVSDTSSFSFMTIASQLIHTGDSDAWNWPKHIFGHPKMRHPSGMWALHDHRDWLILFASIVVMILFDIYIIRPWFERTSRTGLKRTVPVVLCWVFAAMLFNLYIGMRHGKEDAVRWTNGYLLEWMLSMDNIFVFHLVFKLYKTPGTLHAKALFWGVFGAVLFRMLFFVALNALLEIMHLCRYVFGVFLIFSGVQAVRADDDDDDMADSWPVRFLNWLFKDRLLPAPHYDMQGRMWVYTEDQTTGRTKIQVSMLLPVIVCLELTDILFAVDSVSAKVAQIPDQYVAYSSSVFAMFGLRALFFIVEDLINRLHLLKYGLCFILVFIGAELLLSDYVRLPATAVCLLLISVFGLCVILSLVFPQKTNNVKIKDLNKICSKYMLRNMCNIYRWSIIVILVIFVRISKLIVTMVNPIHINNFLIQFFLLPIFDLIKYIKKGIIVLIALFAFFQW